MARRRDPDLVAFDVSADAGSAPSAATPPRRPGPADRWRATDPARRRRVVGLVAGAAVVAVLVTGATVVVADQQRTERLRAAPGGVVSLEGPLVPVWGASVQDVAAVLPDGGLATVEGDQVVARDVGTGALRWKAPLGEGLRCGPRPRPGSSLEWTMPAELVTCVHDADDGAGTVTVLDADGAVVGSRTLPAAGPEASPAVTPGADGTLVVAHHDPRLAEVLQFATSQEAFEQIPQAVPEDARATVLVVDALTGRTRTEVPVHADDGRFGALACYEQRPVTPDPDGPGARFLSDLVLPEPVGSPSLVLYEGCGVAGAATYDGVDLGAAAPDAVSVWVAGDPQQPDRDGWVTGDGARVVSATGDVELVVPEGALVAPAATDGRSSLRFGRVGGGALVALDGGSVRWRADVVDPWVLAATDRVVVVGGPSRVAAYDAGGGARRWQVTPEGRGWWPVGAVTDGRTVVAGRVELRDGVPFPSLLVVDLASGEWTTQELRGEQPVLPVAVDGHLVLLDVTPVDDARRYDVTAVRVLAPG